MGKLAGWAELKIRIKSRETRLEKALTRRALGNHFNVVTYRGVGSGGPWAQWVPLESRPGCSLHKQSPCLQEDVGKSMTTTCLTPRWVLLGP